MANTKPKSGSRWSKKELDFLKRNYTKLTSAEIAKRLGRPVGGVRWQVTQLGVSPELNNPSRDEPIPTDVYIPDMEPVEEPANMVDIRESHQPVHTGLDMPSSPWWQFWKR